MERHVSCSHTNIEGTLCNVVLGSVCRVGGRTTMIEIADMTSVNQYLIPAVSINTFILEAGGKMFMKEGVDALLPIFHISNWKQSDLSELMGDGVVTIIPSQSVNPVHETDNVLSRNMKNFLRSLPPQHITGQFVSRLKTYISELNAGNINEDKSFSRSIAIMKLLGYEITDLSIGKATMKYQPVGKM